MRFVFIKSREFFHQLRRKTLSHGVGYGVEGISSFNGRYLVGFCNWGIGSA